MQQYNYSTKESKVTFFDLVFFFSFFLHIHTEQTCMRCQDKKKQKLAQTKPLNFCLFELFGGFSENLLQKSEPFQPSWQVYSRAATKRVCGACTTQNMREANPRLLLSQPDQNIFGLKSRTEKSSTTQAFENSTMSEFI